MRGTTLRLLRLFPSSRTGGSLSRPATAAAATTAGRSGVCLLCQHHATRPLYLQQQFHFSAQRRWLASSTTSSTPTSQGNVKDDLEQEEGKGEAQQAAEQQALGKVANIPDVTNYYTVFPETLPDGPPPNSPFEIPLPALRREFLKLQALAHPDKFPPGPAKQRAEALSARINEAYRTLADPLHRAQYLLHQWHGIDVTAEDGAAKHALDPETLIEVLEVQETIEDLADVPKDEAEATVNRLRDENAARINASVKALGEAFDRGDIEAARAECVRLRFWYSLGDGLREWEPGRTEIRLVH
ncbi:hypothetical protein VTN77DRAFT_7772 [Rasamsonia byssochlamydoides]|uniref:uncharacterized protein n=1 Tax=Rasamsonia byssochlamydoides TaxID=89139 RepID=UPI00374456A6